MSFSTLYKQNTSGKIMEWKIFLDPPTLTEGPTEIVTVFGQSNGKMQETRDCIREGKNLGKVNATTPWQQAYAKAKSKWQKQIDSNGYVESLEGAVKGESGVPGFVPMLAQAYEKHASKIVWPAAIQPKLDGIRCCAIITEGYVRLFSRKGKPITAVPHIEQELLEIFGGTEYTWQIDGELYNHDLKHDFEKLVSIVRKQSEVDKEKQMQYHIYDANMKGSFINRFVAVHKMITNNPSKYIKAVPTVKANNEDEAELMQADFINQGYEGAMIRNTASPYESKRSYHLQKMKKLRRSR